MLDRVCVRNAFSNVLVPDRVPPATVGAKFFFALMHKDLPGMSQSNKENNRDRFNRLWLGNVRKEIEGRKGPTPAFASIIS